MGLLDLEWCNLVRVGHDAHVLVHIRDLCDVLCFLLGQVPAMECLQLQRTTPPFLRSGASHTEFGELAPHAEDP